MPLTFAHPAAVLPFSRKSKYINFLAMVLGSMAPDFEYFLRGKPYGEIGHTFTGFVIFNLPIVIIVYWIYKTFIHRTLFNHLPSFFQDTYVNKTNLPRLLKIIVFIYSTLIGMLTHVVWDSFTHVSGFMVTKVPILNYSIHIFSFHIPIFKFLQHGSTIVGIIIILAYMYFMTAKYKRDVSGSTTSKQKLIYWGQIALLTTVLSSVWNLLSNMTIESYGVIVIRIIDSALISLLIVSLYFNYLMKVYKNSLETKI
ncbi:hypothetical protein MTP04_05870 [Lysinibacillus sp. PLM2]|nr:hypothetical protein MTP04_05870 [Lysinibacillus sp. PLM2]